MALSKNIQPLNFVVPSLHKLKNQLLKAGFVVIL